MTNFKKKLYTSFTLILPPELAEKLTYVSKYNERSRNKQITVLCKECVAAFEKEHGEIKLEPKESR